MGGPWGQRGHGGEAVEGVEMMEWRGHPSFLSPGPWLGSCLGLRALEWSSGERFTGVAE